ADVPQPREPEQRHLREQLALAGNGLANDHVERRQAIARDHQNAVVADRVVVADFAAGEEGKRGDRRCMESGRHDAAVWLKDRDAIAGARRDSERVRLRASGQVTTCASCPFSYCCATTASGCDLIFGAWPVQPNST